MRFTKEQIQISEEYKTISCMNERDFAAWAQGAGSLERFSEYKQKCIKNRFELLLENGFSE